MSASSPGAAVDRPPRVPWGPIRHQLAYLRHRMQVRYGVPTWWYWQYVGAGAVRVVVLLVVAVLLGAALDMLRHATT